MKARDKYIITGVALTVLLIIIFALYATFWSEDDIVLSK